jgi:hypothetical protein
MAKPPNDIISNWYYLSEGLQASSKDFYAAVDQALQARQIPKIGLTRIELAEGGPFSAKREYLRVVWKDYLFDICGAPFGNGFFFSWWLGQRPSGCLALLTAIPVLGSLISGSHRLKYYQIDTALMFQESVRNAVNEVIDGITTAKGIRALSEAERKPILRGFQR